MNDESVPVTRYVGLFAVIYCGLMIALNVLLQRFEFDVGRGASFGVLIGAAFVTIMTFVRRTKRPPNKQEKTILIWGSFGACFAVPLLGNFAINQIITNSEEWAAFGTSMLRASMPIWLAFLIVAAINYVGLIMIYGWWAKKLIPTLVK